MSTRYKIADVINAGMRNQPVSVLVFHGGPLDGHAYPVRGTPTLNRPVTSCATVYSLARIDFTAWDLRPQGLSHASYETYRYTPAAPAPPCAADCTHTEPVIPLGQRHRKTPDTAADQRR